MLVMELDGVGKMDNLTIAEYRNAALQVEVALLKSAMKRAADLIDKHLYTQSEKVEDASMILRAYVEDQGQRIGEIELLKEAGCDDYTG